MYKRLRKSQLSHIEDFKYLLSLGTKLESFLYETRGCLVESGIYYANFVTQMGTLYYYKCVRTSNAAD